MALHPISHSWWRIENWVRGQGVMEQLPPPAAQHDITLIEQRLDLQLPKEITELLLCHNGSGRFLLPPCFKVLNARGIVESWELKADTSAQSKYYPYRPHYVPFAADGAGTVLYLDASGTAEPAVHEHDREGGSPDITSHPMWESITSLMHHTAEALEFGGVLGRYLPPSEETDFLEWRFADLD
ncbi:SMI1/KNR4 family protein [Streptomyces sp. NPDC006365]|uniref:SMI1/KNR4 family protein n=1 Tax=Streptomyces sp. NPDC006365 TaxID=3364744 RepID=UPI00368FB072